MAQAYGQITITNLVDIVTYIYYAEDEKGTNASIVPSSEKKYIGFYNGVPIPGGQPEKPEGLKIQWLKYVGDKEKSYKLKFNQPQILKFIEKQDGKVTAKFSPENLDIHYIEIVNQEEQLININNLKLELEVIPINSNFSQKLTNLDFLEEIGLLEKDNLNSKWILKIQKIVDYDISLLKENQLTFKPLLETLKEKFINNENILNIQILSKGKKLASNQILLRYGTSSEMATFSLNASGINAAIANTALQFNSNGLTIRNGGILVVNNQNVETLYADPETGNLVLTGTIHANSGFFQGEIQATSGTLNNVIIGKGTETISIGEAGIQSHNFKPNIEGFSIDNTGYIQASRILLGDKARIANRIELGNAYIYNPISEKNPGKFIEVKNENNLEESLISIKADGSGFLGNIKFSGQDSTIFSPKHWKITPTLASFDNVTISGTIHSSVFSTESTQINSSIFIYKDGVIIKEGDILNNYANIETMQIKVENTDIEKLNGKIVYVSTEKREKKFLAKAIKNGEDIIQLTSLSGKIPVANYKIILVLGPSPSILTENHYFNDWLIGINASQTKLEDFSMASNSLTFSELKLSTKNNITQLEAIPKIILGKIPKYYLDSSQINDDYTYGLYADSVYLTGTLMTKYPDNNNNNRFAGINTLSKAKFNVALPDKAIEDKSSVIFWAGSKSSLEEDIQQAPFQVTSGGTLYAKQGYFRGSIITDATIKATTLETARIIGCGENSPALTIEDVYDGIVFKGKKASNSAETIEYLKLTQDGLKLAVPIIFDESNLESSGGYLKGSKSEQSKIIVRSISNDKNEIIIEPEGIGFVDNNTSESLSGSNFLIQPSTFKEQLDFSYQKADFKDNILMINKDFINFAKKTQFQSGVTYGDFSTPVVEYKTTKQGLDIYVYE